MKKYCLLFLLLSFILVGCNKNVEVKMVKYCEKGTLENDKCKIVEEVKPTSITCEDEEFEFNEKSKKCEHTISIPANRRVGCKDEANYTLRNGACYPNKGKGPVKYRTNIYSCPDSGVLNDKKCDFIDEESPIVKCPSGYEVNMKYAKCEKITYVDAQEKEE